MLFWLNSSLLKAIENPDNSAIVSLAIERIVMSQIYGNHIYFSDPNTLSKLMINNIFTDRIKENMRTVYNSFPQKGFLRTFKTYIEVSAGENIREIYHIDEKKIIKVSPDVLMKSNITERAFILCENTRDIDLYKKITQVFMCEKKLLSGLSVTFDPINGGGNNISDQYDTFQKENKKLCFCIVDSDWQYEGDGFGDTASRLFETHKHNVSNGNSKIFCSYSWIQSREVENLVPSKTLREIVNGDKQRLDFVNWLEQLENEDYEVRYFVDIKKGLLFKNIVKNGNKESINYWSAKLKKWLPHCSYCEDNDCEETCPCFGVPGMGDHALENINEVVNKKTPHKLHELIKNHPSLQNKWLTLGEQIFYWVVSAPTAFVN